MFIGINEALLKRIDGLKLSQRNSDWRNAVKAAPWRISADREQWTVKSWTQTEDEDIQIRRAKLVAAVLDGIEINIHPFDEIVGRPTPWVIGCCTAIDVNGDYIPGLLSDNEIDLTMGAHTSINGESAAILRRAVEVFGGKTMREATTEAWRQLVGEWAENAEAAKLKDPSLDAAITGQSTSVLSWRKILRVGLYGYLEEAKAHINEFLRKKDSDIGKFYFWQSSIIVLEAVIRHAGRYGELAARMAAEAGGAERERLTKIAEVCKYVPQNPARTFHEALQSMQFCNLGKMLENPTQNNCHWGRADQYLYPFFIRDLESGIPLEELSSQFADLVGRWGTQTFVSGATQKESHQINFGINSIMVGGLGQDNQDQSNELSYLTLHLAALLNLSSPTVCLRWNEKTPKWLMNKAIRTNLKTKGGIPLFENDEVVVNRYLKDGIPFAEAVEWVSLGCVYPCLPTRAEHYGAEGVAAFNLAGLLHLVLHNGTDINGNQTGLQTGNPREFKSVEALYEAFLKQHEFFCHRIFWLGAVARNVQSAYFRTPLLSVLGIEASMELGQDLLLPHPDYSMYGMSDRAIIDVADSLIAIDNLVFKTKTLTMSQLIDVLDSDFEGVRGEEVRQLCLRQPKFGNDIAEVDELVCRISKDSVGIIRAYDNAPFRPMMISREGLAWHYFGGRGVGALPNGRKALAPLNDGSLSPMRGADKNGPTAVLRSALTANYSEVSYASVLNQKFSASLLAGDENIEKLIAYTNAYMSSGGSHIQYNIIDTEELRAAKLKPEEYSDLVVRIGGFSAYFVQLSPEIQDDVIYRKEYSI